MLRRLSAKNVTITERRDRRDLETLFKQDATIDVLQCIESTEVGKRLPDGTNKYDSWDIERLIEVVKRERQGMKTDGGRHKASQRHTHGRV
jgi:hypothetical protein